MVSVLTDDLSDLKESAISGTNRKIESTFRERYGRKETSPSSGAFVLVHLAKNTKESTTVGSILAYINFARRRGARKNSYLDILRET